jgi:uncharacterized protein
VPALSIESATEVSAKLTVVRSEGRPQPRWQQSPFKSRIRNAGTRRCAGFAPMPPTHDDIAPERSRSESANGAANRIDADAWSKYSRRLEHEGFVVIDSLLSDDESNELASLYARHELFRKTIAMERHGYGRGEYRYFAYPLPPLVEELRATLYERLAPIANRWHEALGIDARFPAALGDFLEQCHAAGQTRPTPLLLRYGPGDYNRLHQDVYGEYVFPFQATILLSAPGVDFEGGEFVLTEQRARMQSRPMVVPLTRGDAVVFAVRQLPTRTARGISRAVLRHGVSVVRSGERTTAGIIFHDAS